MKSSLSTNAPSGKKVVLVRVPEDLFVGVQQMFTQYESLGLGSLAAYLRQYGHIVTILDGTLIDISGNMGSQIRPEFKILLADMQIDTLTNSDLGDVDSSAMAWQLRKVYLAQAILDQQPDIIGFSLISNLVFGRVAEMVELLRKVGVESVICAGGEQASLYARDVMTRIPGLDACVCGEGEETLNELVVRVSDQTSWNEIDGLTWRQAHSIVTNCKRHLVGDLNSLPFPARDTLDNVLSLGGDALIAGSRGCAYHCDFCSIVEFYQAEAHERWRPRSPEIILEEIKHLYHVHGADRFWFIDDEFCGMGDDARIRANTFFSILEKEQLPIRFDICCRANDLMEISGKERHGIDLDLAARAGLRRVFIGIESGSENVLREHFSKGITPDVNLKAINIAENHGIDVLVEFIMFQPWAKLTDIDDNLKLLKNAVWGKQGDIGKYNPHILSSRLYIHRETPLGRRFLTEHLNLLKCGADANDFLLDYEFECRRAGALYHMIENSWQGFAPALQALEQLYRVVDRYWWPECVERDNNETIRHLKTKHADVLHELERIINMEALAFFEETLDFVRSYEFDGESLESTSEKEYSFSDEIYAKTRTMAFEIDNVSTYIYSLAIAEMQEAWKNAQHYSLLGKRVKPPSLLIRERLL